MRKRDKAMGRPGGKSDFVRGKPKNHDGQREAASSIHETFSHYPGKYPDFCRMGASPFLARFRRCPQGAAAFLPPLLDTEACGLTDSSGATN